MSKHMLPERRGRAFTALCLRNVEALLEHYKGAQPSNAAYVSALHEAKKRYRRGESPR